MTLLILQSLFVVVATSFFVGLTTAQNQTSSAAEIEPTIFLASSNGLKAYSLLNSTINVIGSPNKIVSGVTYDPVGDKVYWSLESEIYRANRNGSEVETVVVETEDCKISCLCFLYNKKKITKTSIIDGEIRGLDFDWITGNIYAATHNGSIFACSTKTVPAKQCAEVITGNGQEAGDVAVNPEEGCVSYTFLR